MARNALRTLGNLKNRMAPFGGVVFSIIIIVTLHNSGPAFSARDESQICNRAAAFAAQKTCVPISVLQAISLTETGRRRSGEMQPWPWTVNMEGKGVWFDNEDDARAYVYKNYKRGARSFDVGCFQINYKWHGQAFASIEEMFEPVTNAVYAANFLLKLYQEKGDWGQAAGAYHSRTPKYADKYQARFNAYRKALLGKDRAAPPTLRVVSTDTTDIQPARTEPVVRVNLYPLLQSHDQTRTLGSLVPLRRQQTGQRLIEMGGADG